MADESTHGAPSVRQRQLARQEGHVALSRELVFALGFSVIAVAGWWRAPIIWQSIREFFILQLSIASSPHDVELADVIRKSVLVVVEAVSPLLAVFCATVFLGHWIQHGPLWIPARLAPDLGRLSPEQGWRRLLHRASPGFVVISLLKLTVITTTAAWAISRNAIHIAALSHVPADQMLVASAQLLLRMIGACAFGLAIVAAVDYTWQRWRHEKQLQQSWDPMREEVKAVQNDVSVFRSRRFAPPSRRPKDVTKASSDATSLR